MLIERLMNLADDGVSPAPKDQPDKARIPVHDFFAAQVQIINGNMTVAQVKTYFNMDAATQTEYDALISTAPTGTNATALANKALFIENIHAVLIIAEGRYPTYSTPAEVRIRLGL